MYENKDMNKNKYLEMTVEVPKDLQDLIPGFMNRRKEECVLLESFLEEKDFQEIAKIAHRLKGHGTSYGFAAISELGCDLEATAKHKDTKKTPILIKQFKELIESY